MPQEHVAALLADDPEPERLERAENMPGGKGREPGHGSDLDRLNSHELDALGHGLARPEVRTDRFLHPLAEPV